MAEDKQEEPKVYLCEYGLPMWDRPVREGYFRFDEFYTGHNEITKFLGIDIVNEKIDNFLVYASAAKYLTKLLRLTREFSGFWKAEAEENLKKEGIKPEEEILFSGGIQIYRKGIIPGTELEGYDLSRAGEIWIAQKPTERLAGEEGLKQIIFGNLQSTEDIEQRIEEILKGYEYQEDLEVQRQRRAISSASREGRRSGRWAEQHGYHEY